MTIETIKTKYEEKLMQLPNVIGVALGEKRGKRVIRVLVSNKVSKSSLHAEEMIPETLEGFEVDVEEIGVVKPQS